MADNSMEVCQRQLHHPYRSIPDLPRLRLAFLHEALRDLISIESPVNDHHRSFCLLRNSADELWSVQRVDCIDNKCDVPLKRA